MSIFKVIVTEKEAERIDSIGLLVATVIGIVSILLIAVLSATLIIKNL